jgi:protein ImuB
LRIDLVHRDATPTSIVLGLASTRAVEHIMTVLRERLVRETLPDRVEAIRLVSEESAPLAGKDGDFFATIANAEAGPQLVERLRARLGEDAVRTLRSRADHRPERAWRWEASVSAEATATKDSAAAEWPVRPVWLLQEPYALAGGPAAASLQLESGPERIESGWWDDRDVARDYFVGRNLRGEALWLYRDRDGAWFVHGVFA